MSNPTQNFKKIIPFVKSRIELYRRDIFELFGLDKFSKPYTGHKKILEYIDNKKGFFVVCGGNDGYFQDPTYFLEKFKGWNGIIVEPLPIGELCRRNRKKSYVYRVALVPQGFDKNLIEFIDCNAMSFIKGSIDNEDEWVRQGQESQKIVAKKIVVPARTLQSIIDEYKGKTDFYGKIDLMVVDVEGYELEVLKGLDFEKNHPVHILVEAHTIEKLKVIKEFLAQKNYRLLDEMGHKDYLFENIK